MKIENFKAMEKEFGCRFDVQKTGSPEWVRMFVIRKDGCTIGRYNFRNGELYNLKNYKRDYIRELDETDRVFLRINRYLEDQTLIPLDVYDQLVIKAEQLHKQDLEEKLAWRRANPKLDKDGNPKCRRKLEGKNVRFILTDLVMSY